MFIADVALLLGGIRHVITPGFDAPRSQTHCRFKSLFLFSGQKETVALFGFAPVGPAQPSVVFRILRPKLDSHFSVLNSVVVVPHFVIGPSQPVMKRRILW